MNKLVITKQTIHIHVTLRFIFLAMTTPGLCELPREEVDTYPGSGQGVDNPCLPTPIIFGKNGVLVYIYETGIILFKTPACFVGGFLNDMTGFKIFDENETAYIAIWNGNRVNIYNEDGRLDMYGLLLNGITLDPMKLSLFPQNLELWIEYPRAGVPTPHIALCLSD